MVQEDEQGILGQQLDFSYEINRRATFKSWVFKDNAECSAAKLAEAGFIFTGSRTDPDSVKCFLCDKHLDCWDEDDDPWAEHRKHSPKCSFAKSEKPERELTLSEFIDIRNEFIETIITRTLNKSKQKVDELVDEIGQLLHSLK